MTITDEYNRYEYNGYGAGLEDRVYKCIWFDNRNILRCAKFNYLTLSQVNIEEDANSTYDNSQFMVNYDESDIQTIDSVDNMYVHDTFLSIKEETKNESISNNEDERIDINEDEIPF